MKSFISCAAVICLIFAGGCLKDKNFEDQKNGILNTEVKAVSFPQARNLLGAHVAADTIAVGTDVNSQATPQTNTLVVVALESDFVSATDVRVTIALKPSLVPTTGYSLVPAGSFTVPTTVIIPAGHRSAIVPITFSNTSGFNLSSTYAIGLTITGADNGYQIASNKKDLVVAFSVKNMYDGVYSMKGYALRAGDATLTGNFCCLERSLLTTGATTVLMNDLLAWGNGAGIGIGQPSLSIDPITNVVTITSPGGGMNLPGYNSRYVPATKTFFIGVTWGAGPAARQSIDTLTFLRPR